MKKKFNLYVSLNVMLLLFSTVALTAQEKELGVSFEKDIRPILESKCVKCHGSVDPESGYRIGNRDDAMKFIEAGDSEGSDLYEYLISDDEDELMPPPDEGGPLDDVDIRLIKTWIDEGAVWPDGLELTEQAHEHSNGEDSHEDNTTEDHATAEQETTKADAKNKQPNVYRAIGLLHPATTHLPIGLLLAAGLFALLSLRGNFVMSDCAYYCLWLGTLGAIGACLTGWWFALSEQPKEYVSAFEDLRNMDHKLFWHRSSALVATLFALLLALYAASARNRDPDNGVSWKLGLILLAMGIGFVGQQGGELTWKASHYDELFEVVNQYIPGLVGPKDEPQDKGDGNHSESTEEDSNVSGKSSEEVSESPAETDSTGLIGEQDDVR